MMGISYLRFKYSKLVNARAANIIATLRNKTLKLSILLTVSDINKNAEKAAEYNPNLPDSSHKDKSISKIPKTCKNICTDIICWIKSGT